jgi:hypothetical protein
MVVEEAINANMVQEACGEEKLIPQSLQYRHFKYSFLVFLLFKIREAYTV